ncbi:sensor histidine kinase [Sphingobacterium psychroaquaticum]|uniref:histidine kinase n=1 Tax=Sphingobacterium psychroaquaticum TaxID=561061 RepID=A0A1X7KX96_9SPHI|nr:ATP-binding protein [Sphingobacterium psychroaquaticum]QBQ39670.1 sensor histidine kinase [Sphingobacterium psychroaquaticum]SMG46186.1 two-component system, OmpR family, phosphate regulon sensor histidine kinase PhoR [Sphingobacterium psychroaquaticum]
MNFRTITFLISATVGIALALTDFLHRQTLMIPLLLFALSTTICFIVLQNLFERYVNNRIKNVYKLIHNLKLGKDLKDALGDHISDDPIADAEREVRDWAKQKASEIHTLQEQAQFRKEFLSNISHEFKTPLFATQGYIETLQDGLIDEDPDLAKNFLDKASRNIDRLGYLIHDLDEISKLETGTVSLIIERFDIHALIKECIEDLESKAEKSNIKLVFKGKSTQPLFVKADRKRIQQVLVNLIDNSIKYGKQSGKTTISTFSLFDQILVEVTDDGYGIEEKNLPRVFERFFRTDKSRSRDIGGSGLGLSIVKHIVEAHQQNVNVRSTEGIGTTFGFTLARASAH